MLSLCLFFISNICNSLHSLNVTFLEFWSAGDPSLLCIAVSGFQKEWPTSSYPIRVLSAWLFNGTLYVMSHSLQKSAVFCCHISACISVGTLVEGQSILGCHMWDSKLLLGKQSSMVSSLENFTPTSFTEWTC